MSNPSVDPYLIRADRATARGVATMLRVLMAAQAAFAVVLALVATPHTWIAEGDQLLVHQVVIIVLALVLAGTAVVLLTRAPEAVATRVAVGGLQLAFSGLLIHATGGRVETHFHIFASLAILAFYRDYWVILAATAVTGVDHLVRGYGFPLSIFGDHHVMVWHPLEHIAWVVFMDVFVFIGIFAQRQQVVLDARRQQEIEELQNRTALVLERALAQVRLGSDLGAETRQALAQTEGIVGTARDLVGWSQRLGSAVDEAEKAEAATSGRFDDLKRSTEGQSAQIRDSVEAVEHLFQKAGENARVSQDQAAELDALGNEGLAVERDIRQTVAALGKLSQAGAEIRSIVEVISNVAERTQLLSLNAAIEAAHAGASGRGFSVVAVEIRKLSEQTGSQVSQINAQVDLIVGELDRASSWGHAIDQRFAAILTRLQGTSEAFALIRANADAVASDVQRVRDSQQALAAMAAEMGSAARASAQDQAVVQSALDAIQDTGAELVTVAATLEATASAVAQTVARVSAVADQLNEELQSLH